MEDNLKDYQNEKFLDDKNQVQSSQNVKKSPFVSQYYNIMGINTEDTFQLDQIFNQHFQKCQKKMAQYGITYSRQRIFPSPFKVYKIFESYNHSVQIFHIQLSFFQLDIQVFHAKRDKFQFLCQLNYLNNGSFGEIYTFQNQLYFNQQFVIKVIQKRNVSGQRLQILKQISLLKIVGALQIGIPPNNLFGFDIIETQNQYIISMQNGVQIDGQIIFQHIHDKERFAKQLQNIKMSILLLHSCLIIHNDMKPQNILFSPSLNKLVLIDFGLSQAMPFSLGFYQMQTFKGSIFYCCQQIKKIAFNFECDFADLYYNDAVCWKNSKKYLDDMFQNNFLMAMQWGGQSITYKSCLPVQQQTNNVACDFLAVKIIFFLLRQDSNQFQRFVNSNINYINYLKNNLTKIAFIFKQILPNQQSKLTFETFFRQFQDQHQHEDKDKLKNSIQIHEKVHFVYQLNQVPIQRHTEEAYNQRISISQRLLSCKFLECLQKNLLNEQTKLYLLKLLQPFLDYQKYQQIQKISLKQLFVYGFDFIFNIINKRIQKAKSELETIIQTIYNSKQENSKQQMLFREKLSFILKQTKILALTIHKYFGYLQFKYSIYYICKCEGVLNQNFKYFNSIFFNYKSTQHQQIQNQFFTILFILADLLYNFLRFVSFLLIFHIIFYDYFHLC